MHWQRTAAERSFCRLGGTHTKQPARFVICVILLVILAWYIGAMVNFLPFYSDDLTISAIGFSTLIICTVLALCTVLILRKK